jgi:hypothetical protein
MRHPTDFQRFRTLPLPSPRGQGLRGKPQASPDLRSEAEDLLREMAFVLHVTRSLKRTMIDERISGGTLPSGTPTSGV